MVHTMSRFSLKYVLGVLFKGVVKRSGIKMAIQKKVPNFSNACTSFNH